METEKTTPKKTKKNKSSKVPPMPEPPCKGKKCLEPPPPRPDTNPCSKYLKWYKLAYYGLMVILSTSIRIWILKYVLILQLTYPAIFRIVENVLQIQHFVLLNVLSTKDGALRVNQNTNVNIFLIALGNRLLEIVYEIMVRRCNYPDFTYCRRVIT